MVSYGDILLNALKFSIQPKRWLPFFLVDTVFLLFGIAYFLSNASYFINMVASVQSNPATFLSLFNIAIIAFMGLIVWALLKLYISGAIIHQSVKPKELGKSWEVARKRYLSLLAVSIIMTGLTAVVNFVPYIGWVFAIILGLMFFFVRAAVVAKTLNFDNSIRDSYHIFRNRVGTVFLIWLAVLLISLLITTIFLIPTIVIAWNIIAPLIFQVSSPSVASLILSSLLDNIWSILIGIEIVLVGMAISNVFKLKAETDFYLRFKKKRLGLF